MSTDKKAHFFAGVAIAATVTLYTAQPTYGIAATVASAALKEVLDILGMGTPDADDFVAIEAGPSKAVQEASRRDVYQIEADPLFFMAQRGEATIEEWQAKIAEIKARFPYPAE